ncbi:MFS transporter [Acuticoccus kandeliae]|uniref:MFS transporter n=1 Tax=Acuticoccus kandeliae TaxID=2073160 RepID=UPI001B3B8699|nr:MFS transporter [Acuticoccus kandeliae]
MTIAAATMSDAPAEPHPNAVLAVVLTGYLMIVLDLSIVYTGLPQIAESMSLDPVGLSWVQNAYLLCFGGFLLLGARAGDIIGRKRMLMIGVAVFTFASLVIGIAETPAALIGARGLQGLGAAILAPAVLSLISISFPEGAPRSRALAIYAMVAGAGSSLGMVLGGVFAGALSWRVGFLVNVPLGIALWFAARQVLAETPRRSGHVDIPGALTSTAGMLLLVFAIVRSADHGWGDWTTCVPALAALVLLAAFIAIERRAAEPILPLRLFGSASRSAALVARGCFIGAMVSFFFFTAQLMQSVLHYTPIEAGLGFLPMTVATFLAALAVPRLTRSLGNAGLLTLALALLSAGLVWLSFAGADATYWADLGAPMLLIGLGNGAALGPLTVAGVAGVDNEDQGAASGLVNVAHQLGGSLGLAVLVTVFAAFADREGGSLIASLGAATFGEALLMAVGLVLTLAFIRPAEMRRAAR